VPTVDPDQIQREMEQAMAEPWVRGIGAARAMAALGDAQAAASFYVACLEMLDADWVPDACLEDIIALGPRRAHVLLVWMLDNADTVSFLPGGLQFPDDFDDADGPSQSAIALRSAALEGLGALIGSGMLPAAEREQAFEKLVGYSAGSANEPYFQGVAEGLARSVDPRAVPLLETLAQRRGSLDARQAAQRGLAVGFGDQDAIARLRRDLDDRDLEIQLRAAQSLYPSASS
jgi:hypothetical protein